MYLSRACFVFTLQQLSHSPPWLQEELSRTIAGLLVQFVGEQSTEMEAAFEAARFHASAASALNIDNAGRLAEVAGAVSQELQVCQHGCDLNALG